MSESEIIRQITTTLISRAPDRRRFILTEVALNLGVDPLPRANEPLRTIFDYLLEKGRVSVPELYVLLPQTPRKQIYNALAYLVRRGRIIRDGRASYRTVA